MDRHIYAQQSNSEVAALDNDPVLIAETLARQTLSDRLIRTAYQYDQTLHRTMRENAEAARVACIDVHCMTEMGGEYSTTTWKLRSERSAEPRERPSDNTVELEPAEWENNLSRLAATLGAAPGAQTGPSKGGDSEHISTDSLAAPPGARTAPKSGGSPALLPLSRVSGIEETAEAFVVTGVLSQADREIVTASVTWRKRPFDEWWAGKVQAGTISSLPPRAMSGPLIIPHPRGFEDAPDTWTPVPAARLDTRGYHTAVWTGTEMIVWGGMSGNFYLDSGYRYNPSTDTWTTTSVDNAPTRRNLHTAVWTGSEMIIWGGYSDSAPYSLNSGGRYNPATNAWTPTSTTGNAPVAHYYHTAVWTGSEMIVWGGSATDGGNTGGRYNPNTDSWLPTSTGASVPSARFWHTAVWTGSRMIIWGGYYSNIYQNTGGLYDPLNDSWTPTSSGANVPSVRYNHSAVWTGSEMIVWGGTAASVMNTGGRYRPSTNSWTPTSTGANVPPARDQHSAVWTGSEMIVWGGLWLGSDTKSGGRYNPSTNTWIATSTLNNQTPRSPRSTTIRS